MSGALEVEIDSLCRHPALVPAVARLIYDEFWADRDGMTVADLTTHLQRVRDPARMPLSLVALHADRLVGTVNLIDNDDRKRAHLHPWLAAMVVADGFRGRGIGTRLVRSLLAQAKGLGFRSVYFGTDGPRFYARLGAVLHEQVTEAFCIMRFPLDDAPRACRP